MATELNTPILDDGLRRIPFFNGRVLTAEDLQTEQDADATERRRLGRALGTGVIDGLFVERGPGELPTTLTVESGLALAPNGHVVDLPSSVEVAVVSQVEREESAGTEGRFADCSSQDVVVTSGTGAYVLVVEPASENRGRTPRGRIGGDGSAAECGAQYRLEGARLRLVPLDPTEPELVPEARRGPLQDRRAAIEARIDDDAAPLPTDVSKLRNLWAHVCLRSPWFPEETAGLYDTLRARSRGGASGPAGPVEQLRGNDRIGDDAVPVGLLYWVPDGILFVDNWSVRRRVHRRISNFSGHVLDRRRAEGEAAFYQFQAHVADLTGSGGPAEQLPVLEARVFFEYLPAAGLVPVETEGPHEEGLDFVDELTHQGPVYMEGAEVSRLLEQSFLAPPHRIDSGEMLVLYRVRQNRQSDTGTSYLLFASGHLPLRGDARYDVSRWSYSQYGPVVHS